MEKVQVYRNLHRTEEDGTHVYSVRNDKGIVVDHVTEITLSRPILRVGPKGNQRVRDEKRKNVHAYIQGMCAGDARESPWAYHQHIFRRRHCGPTALSPLRGFQSGSGRDDARHGARARR